MGGIEAIFEATPQQIDEPISRRRVGRKSIGRLETPAAAAGSEDPNPIVFAHHHRSLASQ
jgi:hypothetical protein